MKNKTYIWLLILPLVLTLSACGAKKTNNPEQNMPTNNNTVTEQKEEENTKVSATALEMMKGGKSLDCTFSFEDQEQKMVQSGRFFVDGTKGRFRTDIDATISGENSMKVKMYSLSDGKYLYSWNDFQEKSAFKISLDKTTEVDNEGAQKTEDLDRRIDFDCRPWKVDESKFVVPTDKNFVDMDVLMQQMTNSANNATPNVCGLCDQIPDEKTKTECKKTNCSQ